MEISQVRIAIALERIADALESIEHKVVDQDNPVSPADVRNKAKARRAAARHSRTLKDTE
jgi:hypothetical protein